MDTLDILSLIICSGNKIFGGCLRKKPGVQKLPVETVVNIISLYTAQKTFYLLNPLWPTGRVLEQRDENASFYGLQIGSYLSFNFETAVPNESLARWRKTTTDSSFLYCLSALPGPFFACRTKTRILSLLHSSGNHGKQLSGHRSS